MNAQPRLLETHVPSQPKAAVLVLHGGANRPGNPMVSPTQLSVLRMIPVARRIARSGGDRLAVFRVLNSVRGWDSERTPVADVDWALGLLAERFGPDLPIGLVGHSLGGRAALLAGDAAPVRSVVALNPWLHPTETAELSGRQVLIVHGDDDRIASPEHSRAVARRIGRTSRVGFVAVPGARHAMLRHGRLFERAASDFVNATLLGDRAAECAADPVARVLRGESWVEA